MTRFVVGDDRSQSTLFPERLDDYLGEDNPVRAIDVFVDELDLAELGFGGVEPEAGAVAGWGLHPLESAAFARRTPPADVSNHQKMHLGAAPAPSVCRVWDYTASGGRQA